MLLEEVHRRFNPLRRSWVLCSPHRAKRPWQGEQEKITEEKPEYDPKCYLCPGNTRANGEHNPEYSETFVFPNDFAAVNQDSTSPALKGDLFRADPVSGKCVVICFSPKHNLTLAHMSKDALVKVIDAWQQVYQSAVEDPTINYCQIFENKGAAMGCSNPHPHGQAWMLNIIPDEPQIEHDSLAAYYNEHGTHLLEDYAAKELEEGTRVIDANDTFVCVVPFWATWPFETLVMSKKRIRSIAELDSKQKQDLADILSKTTVRYDNLFQCPFPYSMGLHQAFTGGDAQDVEHLLFHFYPPLLRSASVRKFLVGFEMLGMPQRDITPESAADRLRECSTVHY